jgi:hypothetical protein
MFREIIEVCFENQAIFIDVFCGKRVDLLMLNLMVDVWKKHTGLKG